MRLCSYVVVIDKGFAPNPFSGFCTLAARTPNHQGLRLKEGDWVLGNSSSAEGRRLIYAMRISEVLDFDKYYRDNRFARKKAKAGTWRDRCGDNIYFRNKAGDWVRGVSFHHTSLDSLRQDTRRPRVFISDHFFYFGENARALPPKFASLARTCQGCKYHPGNLVEEFIKWLEQTYKPRLHGEPRDRDESTDLKCEPIQPRMRQTGSGKCT